MISANSNVAVLTPSRRVVVEPMRFAALSPWLQEVMLAWLEESKYGFQDVLANTVIVGRSCFLYDPARDVFLNRGVLGRTLVQPEVRFSAIREIVAAVGELDRPRAFQCMLIGESKDWTDLVILPIILDGTPVYSVTVEGW